VKIDLEEHVSTEIIRAMHEGAADIGICNPRAGWAGCRPALPAGPAGADRAGGHPLAALPAVWFADTLDHDHVGLHGNSAIDLAMREPRRRRAASRCGCASTSPAWTRCAG
jgi:DNA-binding transcriptional LysR family regulator